MQKPLLPLPQHHGGYIPPSTGPQTTIYGVRFFSLCLMIQELSAIMLVQILVSTFITHTVT